MLESLEAGLRTWPWLTEATLSRSSLWLLIVSAVLLLWGSLRLIRRRKSASKGIKACLVGLVIALLTLGNAIVAAQWASYPVLLAEREIADIRFGKIKDERFSLNIRPIPLPGQTRPLPIPTGEWQVEGQEWRLSARLIQQTPFTGKTARFQLHRLVTRRLSTEGHSQPNRAYLFRARPQPDLWRFALKKLDWLPGLKLRALTTDFLPMADGLVYRVSMTPTEIVARPVKPD